MGSRRAAQARRDRDVGSFDRRARSYDRDWRAEFHRIVVGRSAQVAPRAGVEPASVLDVGCGTGSLLRLLAERLSGATSLVGVDPAPTMIEVGAAAARLHPIARRRVYDLGPLPLVHAVIAEPARLAAGA